MFATSCLQLGVDLMTVVTLGKYEVIKAVALIYLQSLGNKV